MSDVSTLSQEYKVASALSEALDKALLALVGTQSTSEPARMQRRGAMRSSAAFSTPASGESADVAGEETHSPLMRVSNDSAGNDSSNVGELVEVLDELVAKLDPSGRGLSNLSAQLRVPAALVVRLGKERRGDLAYYVDDLTDLANHLRNAPTQLAESELAMLDHLASLADAHATSLFRRLMRR